MTVLSEAFDRATVNVMLLVPELPSPTVELAMDTMRQVTGAASSFLIVPVAVALPRFAPLGFDSVTVKVSSGSTVVSPRALTVICWLVTPGENVSVPDAAVKSDPAVAVPLPVT